MMAGERGQRPLEAGNTVLVRRRALGDVVLLGAVTAALDGPVTVVTEARYVDVARALIGVDRVVPWDGPVPEGRVVDLQRDLRTLQRFPLASRLRKHSLLRGLRWLGIEATRPTVPELYGHAVGVAPRSPPWIVGVAVERTALALLPGASCDPKRWAPLRFVAVGKRLSTSFSEVIVVGGPGEERLVADVAGAIPGAHAVAGPGFTEAIAAFQRSAVAVGGDTGLLHLAAACGAKPVGLFGPTHEADGFFPYDGTVVSLQMPCRPCTRHRLVACPVGHHGCMGIGVEAVIEAVVDLAGHPRTAQCTG